MTQEQRDKIVLKDEQDKMFIRLIDCLLQQLMEKIDKMREVAGVILQKILKLRYELDREGRYGFNESFPDKDALLTLFVHYKFFDESTPEEISFDQDNQIQKLPWRNPTFVFHHIGSLLDSETFRLGLIKGIISSSGGLTESTLRESTDVL